MNLVIESPRAVKGAAHLVVVFLALFALLAVYDQYKQQILAVREGMRAQLEQHTSRSIAKFETHLAQHYLQNDIELNLGDDSPCLSPAKIEKRRKLDKLFSRRLEETSMHILLESRSWRSLERSNGAPMVFLDGNRLVIRSEQYLGQACGRGGEAVMQVTESHLIGLALSREGQFSNVERVLNLHLDVRGQAPLSFSIHFDAQGLSHYEKVSSGVTLPTAIKVAQAQEGKVLVDNRFLRGYSDPSLGLKLVYFSEVQAESFYAVFIAFNKVELLMLLGLLLCLVAADWLVLHLVDSSLAFHRASTRDFLTGLYNRRAALDLAASELSRAGRTGRLMSAVLMDIDHFKRINDTYGHDCGDQVLKFFGEQLRQSMRQEDVLARVGGEEFLVLLPETNSKQARIAVERLLQALREAHVEYDGKRISITCSAGIGTWRGAGESFDSLYIRCDELLYQAKQQGRDRCIDESEAAVAS